MDNIAERIQATQKAFKQWSVSIKEMDKIRQKKDEESSYQFLAYRNSLIKTFEMCFDLFWKLGKILLEQKHGIIAASPGKTFDDMLQVGSITNEERKKLTAITKDRNLTTHTYDEDFAQEISLRIEEYYGLMYELVTKIEQELR